MSRKEMVSAKIGGKTFDRLENYADEEEISRSQAVDRMVKQGLDVEESDMRLVPVKTDGGTRIENQLQKNEKELENVKQELKSEFKSRQREQTQTQTLQTALTVAGVLFIAAQFSVGLPTWFVLLAGTGLVVGLAGTTARGLSYV